MAEYRYAGPGPVPDPEGELVHPGDVREYAEEPGWGPWELLGEPEPAGLLRWNGEVTPAPAPPLPPPAVPAGDPPADPEGM
jgi:hypothetical protein